MYVNDIQNTHADTKLEGLECSKRVPEFLDHQCQRFFNVKLHVLTTPDEDSYLSTAVLYQASTERLPSEQ